jgi:hypothetical protein
MIWTPGTRDNSRLPLRRFYDRFSSGHSLHSHPLKHPFIPLAFWWTDSILGLSRRSRSALSLLFFVLDQDLRFGDLGGVDLAVSAISASD